MINWKYVSLLFVAMYILGMLAACQPVPTTQEDNQSTSTIKPTPEEPTPEKLTTEEQMPVAESIFIPLPQRAGPRMQTSGSVPHVQIGVESVPEVNDELRRRAFALPDVENHPTIVSLPGAEGMWISDGVPITHPEAIVNGREFAHIHPDGSLHAPLPYERALEAVEKGWAERHPWADQRDGWDGFVMLFTPQSMAELDVTFQLIVESYNHVTGRTVQASDLTD